MDNIVTINRAWNQTCSFTLFKSVTENNTQHNKVILPLLLHKSAGNFQRVHHKLGHKFHAPVESLLRYWYCPFNVFYQFPLWTIWWFHLSTPAKSFSKSVSVRLRLEISSLYNCLTFCRSQLGFRTIHVVTSHGKCSILNSLDPNFNKILKWFHISCEKRKKGLRFWSYYTWIITWYFWSNTQISRTLSYFSEPCNNNNNNNNMWTYIAHVSTKAQGALLPLLMRLINHSWNHLSSLGSIQLNCCHYSTYKANHPTLPSQVPI